MKFIGRETERQLLETILQSQKPEFVAIYGRRRVGKTFLVRQFFSTKKTIFLNVSGAKDAPMREQLEHFTEQMGDAFFRGITPKLSKNWNEAFRVLTETMRGVAKNKKIVLFFDEFPWMVTKNSRLLQTLDYYWNQHWSDDKRVKLIICGSSASWIVEKLIHNRGGLYNRVTESIHLEPFNLRDTKRFLHKKGIKLNNRQVTQLYMTIGGIPYYLDKIDRGLTAAQIIEQLAFKKSSFLLNEFETLFASLFDNYEGYIEIIRAIAETRHGLGQKTLFEKLDKSFKGYSGLSKLDALEKSGFIMSFIPHFHKNKGVHYKVIDEYTLFYFHWIEPVKTSLLKSGLRKGYWEQMQLLPAWRSWSGYAFESICYKHLAQISQALALSPTAIPNTWRYVPNKKSQALGAQIDLLFDRTDDAITLCEIKYTTSAFKIDKAYAKKLQQKLDVFSSRTKTKKQLFLTMIVSAGLKATTYSDQLIDKIVVLDDLFNLEI